MGDELPAKLEEAYLRRMPEELRTKLEKMPRNVRVEVVKALDEYHRFIEEKTYRLLLRLVEALSQRP